jgi:hypothetical protein
MDRKRWLILFVVLVVVAPFASRRPDPVQRLLGLDGGAGTLGKAVVGVVVTVSVVVALAYLLKRRKERP